MNTLYFEALEFNDLSQTAQEKSFFLLSMQPQ
jgi:hypothetical protein